MSGISIHFVLNGQDTTITTRPTKTLLEVLRDDLGLTGAKDACGGEGECGACTVILGGKAVNSCLVLIGQAEGGEILTIEGLEEKDNIHPIQKAFVEVGAVQCGYCIPGAVMSTKALLDNDSKPTNDDIRQALSGNLCRCTGYNKMIDAIHLVMKEGYDG